MAQDPRKYLQDTCGPIGNPDLAQARKSGFFRTLGKIGDLEILNEVDNEIGQGLRALETISNQIRLGQGAPEVFRNSDTSAEAGENAVLEQTSIDPNQTRTQGVEFNPAVANRALGQARTIYERVQQGNFEIRDIPEAIQDLGNLKQLLGGIFTPIPGEEGKDNKCDPSPYARDLIALAPKHKFMFVVEFVFTEDYVSTFPDDIDFAFVVKRSTRPNINFEYEDINYYNFRTKVLKRSEFQPMSMTFYDDMTDYALRFYNNYLRSIAPIASSKQENKMLFEESGMAFNDPTNSASIQAVGDTTRTIIDYCRLYHIVEGGKFVDRYRFDNPRLQAIQLDDLDMIDSGAGTEVTIEFNYDGLEIEPKLPINSDGLAGHLTDLTKGGIFPIRPRLGSDQPTAQGSGLV